MRLHYFTILICLLFGFSSLYSQNIINYKSLEARPGQINGWKINYGDSAEWKNAGYNDGNWADFSLFNKTDAPELPIYWLRAVIDLKNAAPNVHALSLVIHFLGSAYEIYWDGLLVSSNGKIGKDLNATESGKAMQLVALPLDFTKDGMHTLAFRVSKKVKSGADIKPSVTIASNSQINDYLENRNIFIIIIASVFFTFALFNLILFWGFNKNAALLYLTLFCLAQSFKIALESTSIPANFNEGVFLFLMNLIHPLVIISGIFLTAFLVYKFPIPNKKQLFLAYIVLSVVSYFLISARIYIVIMMSASFLLVLYAIYKKYEGGSLSLIGLIGFGVITYMGYLGYINYGYFVGIIFFIFCMTISTAKQISVQIYQKNQSMTRTARLESQLLKKNIQPHFILNSLSSLQELIETSPEQAAGFIDALADEFRIFSQVSNEKLISIKDELKICEAHLKIMGFRKESKFILTTEGITGTELVPPAVFHTLVENGLTHGYGKKNSGTFILTKEIIDDGILYNLFNDSDPAKTPDPDKKGTGLKYVESRLEESYPGRWHLASGPVDNGWLVSIKILD